VTEADEEERGERRDHIASRHANRSGSSVAAQKVAFSFLMPMDDSDERGRPSDSESATGLSEGGSSAAGGAGAGWREGSDWRRARRQQDDAPGPWLKPNRQRLTNVLIGSRLSGRSELSL